MERGRCFKQCESSNDLKSNACCVAQSPSPRIRAAWVTTSKLSFVFLVFMSEQPATTSFSDNIREESLFEEQSLQISWYLKNPKP